MPEDKDLVLNRIKEMYGSDAEFDPRQPGFDLRLEKFNERVKMIAPRVNR